MTEVLCLDMQYTTPQTPGGACWVGRKSWWTTSAQCYKVPNPKGVRKLEGTQSLSSSCHCSRGKGELGRAKSWGESAHRNVWNVDEFSGIQVASFPKKKAHKCGKPIIREVYSFRTTPPQTRLYKEVAYRLVGHFKDLSTYLSQIFLRQEPQQWKKGRHQYHWCYTPKGLFSTTGWKGHFPIRSAKKNISWTSSCKLLRPRPFDGFSIPWPRKGRYQRLKKCRWKKKGQALFCRFGLGVIRKIWFWWLKPSEFINNQDLDFWSRARSK